MSRSSSPSTLAEPPPNGRREEVTDTDRALLDTTPGSENIIQKTEDDSNAAVIVTKIQLNSQGDEEATDEEVALANTMGVFCLDLGIGRICDEDASSGKLFQGIEAELTDEERSKAPIFYPRGIVGIH